MSKFTFSATDMHGLPVEAKQAVMDALWTVYAAETRPSVPEVEAFQTQVATLPWGMKPEELQGLLAAAEAKLAATIAVRGQDTVRDYIDRIADRIPSSGVREKTLCAIHRLIPEDKLAESATLAAFCEAFGIQPRRAEEIAAEARGKA